MMFLKIKCIGMNKNALKIIWLNAPKSITHAVSRYHRESSEPFSGRKSEKYYMSRVRKSTSDEDQVKASIISKQHKLFVRLNFVPEKNK